jgi:hypothetical protein
MTQNPSGMSPTIVARALVCVSLLIVAAVLGAIAGQTMRAFAGH